LRILVAEDGNFTVAFKIGERLLIVLIRQSASSKWLGQIGRRPCTATGVSEVSLENAQKHWNVDLCHELKSLEMCRQNAANLHVSNKQ